MQTVVLSYESAAGLALAFVAIGWLIRDRGIFSSAVRTRPSAAQAKTETPAAAPAAIALAEKSSVADVLDHSLALKRAKDQLVVDDAIRSAAIAATDRILGPGAPAK